MRASFLILTSLAAVAFGPAARAAVIITALPDPALVYDDFLGVQYPIDIDGNGSVDFTFAADFSASGLRTERGNRAIYRTTSPPDLGGPIPPLQSGYIIGLDLAASSFGELAWRSSDLLGGYVDPGEIAFISLSIVLSSGSSSLFPEEGLRAPIGIEFEADDGIHYGYIDIWARRGYPGLYVYGWAYESEPGVPIAAGLVPEPSTVILLSLGTLMLVSRRGRKQQGTIGSPGVISSRVPHHPAYGSVQGGSNQTRAFGPE